MSYLPAFFGRIGSKRQLVPKILKLFPQNYSVYGEPFIGGGSVYFAKPPSEKEYINDLDKGLIDGYRLLKNAPSAEELLDIAITETRDFRVKKTDSPSEVKRKKQIEESVVRRIEAFIQAPARTNAQRLLKRLYCSRNTFGFKGSGKIYNFTTHIPKLKNIELYRERLKNTTILSEDYRTFIKKIDSKDTFFYLDPPYENSEGLYDDFSIDLEEMSNILKQIKGRFLLSLNDSPNVRRIFRGFKIKSVIFKGSDTHKIDENNVLNWVGSADRKEVLIYNY